MLASIGDIKLSAIPGRWLDSIDRPYFGLHPQGFAVSSAFRATSAFRHHGIDAVQSRFCARARALALHPKKVSACPEVGGLSTPAKGSPAAAALPLSRPGCIREEDIKAFVALWKKRRVKDQRPPAQGSGFLYRPYGEVVEADGDIPPRRRRWSRPLCPRFLRGRCCRRSRRA